MFKQRYQIHGCILFYMIVTTGQAQAVTFSDGDFSSGWVDISLTVDDPGVAGTGPLTSTGSNYLRLFNGNPGAFRESQHDITFGDVVKTGGVNNNAVYDPGTSGAIASIDFSIDLLEDPFVAGSSGYSLVLVQGGTSYYSETFSFANPTWQTFQQYGFTAADFDTNPVFDVPGGTRNGQQPDFSATGSPITFGYSLGNQLGSVGSINLAHGADNFSVTVNIQPPPDDDNDGVPNGSDLCPNTPTGEAVDANGCSWSQRDDDNDGVLNPSDLCPNTPMGEAVDANGCSWPQRDDDNDGVSNTSDLCPNTPTGEQVGSNGCPPQVTQNDIYKASAESAVSWLEQQQNGDGSWGANDGTRTLVTSEAVLALKRVAGRNTAYYSGITWLENHGAANVDDIARRVLTLAPHGDDVTADSQYLADAQRLSVSGNNGWGLSPVYNGEPLDTALALLASAQLGLTANIQAALDFLKSSQLTGVEQGWPLTEGSATDPVTTALVVQAMIAYLSLDPSLSTNITNALTTLNSLVDATASALIRAHTALALLRDDAASDPARVLLDSLVSVQAIDGSWNGELYTTEVVVRALAAALGSEWAGLDDPVFVPDANLRAAINLSLGRNLGDSLSVREMNALTDLNAPGAGISDLTGLESAINLNSIDLGGNQITDLSPLAGLQNLNQVTLTGNPLSDAVDSDGDGLGDLTEANAGTNPFNMDTDGDGISDLADLFPLIPADGDLNADGLVNAADVLIATQIVLGTLLPDTYLGHGDVAPLVGGVPSPNGEINAGDLLVIQRKALGQVNF